MPSTTVVIPLDEAMEDVTDVIASLLEDFEISAFVSYEGRPSTPPSFRGHPDNWEDGDGGCADITDIEACPADQLLAVMKRPEFLDELKRLLHKRVKDAFNDIDEADLFEPDFDEPDYDDYDRYADYEP